MKGVQWHSPEINITGSAQDVNSQNELETHLYNHCHISQRSVSYITCPYLMWRDDIIANAKEG